MGQKVHPYGFRLGYIFDWQSKWFDERHYREFLYDDISIRRAIKEMLPDAGISRIEIERNANHVTVAIYTARPGIVIGRGGQRVDELRAHLESISGRRVRVNINELRVPEMDAALVARSIADQIERRVSHRRAMKQGMARTMQRGALGIKVRAAGRLGGREMTRREQVMVGRVPLHTLRADIDFGTAEAHTSLGRIGIKVWIYKGDRIEESRKGRPAAKEEIIDAEAAPEAEAEAAVEAAPPSEAAAPAEGAEKEEAAAGEAAVEDKGAKDEAPPEAGSESAGEGEKEG